MLALELLKCLVRDERAFNVEIIDSVNRSLKVVCWEWETLAVLETHIFENLGLAEFSQCLAFLAEVCGE